MIRKLAVANFLLALTLLSAPPLLSATVYAADVVVAQQGTSPRELEPRYQPVRPVPPEEQSSYNSDYIFSLTRGVADSTIHPAGKAPLFLFTIPLDFVILPVTTLAGFF